MVNGGCWIKANGIWLHTGPGGSAPFENDEKYAKTVDTSLDASASITAITNDGCPSFRCRNEHGRVNIETCKLNDKCAVVSG